MPDWAKNESGRQTRLVKEVFGVFDIFWQFGVPLAPLHGAFSHDAENDQIFAFFLRILKNAKKPIFGVLAEVKMGVRVTKNRKNSKISKIDP